MSSLLPQNLGNLKNDLKQYKGVGLDERKGIEIHK
jgi:hypothetical protein